MGGHYSARAQRVDLLGNFRKEARDTQGTRRAGPIPTHRRRPPSLLLAGLSASEEWHADASLDLTFASLFVFSEFILRPEHFF